MLPKIQEFHLKTGSSPHLFQGLSIAASAWKASHTNGSMTGPFVSFVKSSEPTASFVRRRWSSPPRWPEIKPPQLMAVPQDKLSGPYTSECMPEDTSISPTTSNNLQNTFKPLTNGYCTVSKKVKKTHWVRSLIKASCFIPGHCQHLGSWKPGPGLPPDCSWECQGLPCGQGLPPAHLHPLQNDWRAATTKFLPHPYWAL